MSEQINQETSLIFKIVMFLFDGVFYGIIVLGSMAIGFGMGLEEGNKNALTGKPDYELVKHPDGTVSWELIEESKN